MRPPLAALDPSTAGSAVTGVRELFDELLDLSADERARRLACVHLAPADRHRLQAMLDATEGHRSLIDLPLEAAIERLRDDDEQILHRMVGTRIGAFRLLELIGEGGSSVVFRAERPAGLGAQAVALKLLQRGLWSPETRRRFMREQAILARLSHPDIARLIEAGVSESGIPYIAMELVTGEPIDKAMDRMRMPLEARLRWFVRLCRAVDAAHAALVVHCDLKPGNVVIDAQGAMKVLDFGVAQLVGQVETLGGEHAMTPEYASPEQLRGEPPGITADVHALGVMLAQIVTRHRLRAGDPPASQVVARDRTGQTRPGLWPRPRLARALRGDFDAIVVRAIDPDAAARYRSAAALASDIEGFLSSRPIEANPPSRRRRFLLFARRHRTALPVGMVLGAALLASVVVAWQQAAAARDALARADTMRGFILTAFAQAKPGRPGAEAATVVDAVESALADLDDRDDSPATLELRVRLGEVLSLQGAHPRAATVLGEVRDRASALFGADHPMVYEAEFLFAKNTALDGDRAAARKELDRLAATVPPRLEALHVDLSTTSGWLAGLMHEPARAIAEARDALALARALGDTGRTLQAQRALGAALLAGGEGAKAIPIFEDLLAQRKARHGEVHARVAAEEAGLARAHRMVGDLRAAEAHARVAVDIGRQVYPDDHWHKALHLNSLYMVLCEQRRFEEARAVNGEVQDIYAKTFPPNHPDLLATAVNSVTIDAHLGRWEQALAQSERVMQGYRDGGIEATWGGMLAGIVDAHVRGMARGWHEGERAFREVGSRRMEQPDPRLIAILHERKARLAFDLGRIGDARSALDTAPVAQTLDPQMRVRIGVLRAELLVAEREWAQASSALREVHAAAQALPVPEALAAAHAALMLAWVAQQTGATTPGHVDDDAARAWAELRYPPRHVARLADRLGLAPRPAF